MRQTYPGSTEVSTAGRGPGLSGDRGMRIEVAAGLVPALGLALGLGLGLGAGCVVAQSGPEAPPQRASGESFDDDAFDDEPLSGCIPEPVDMSEPAAREQATAEVELTLAPLDDSLTPKQHTAIARELFAEGQEAFELGDYAEAIEMWMEAYAHVPDLHALAFNIGKAWQHLRQCPQARGAFRHAVDHSDEATIVEAAQHELDKGYCAPARAG